MQVKPLGSTKLVQCPHVGEQDALLSHLSAGKQRSYKAAVGWRKGI